MNRPKSFTLVLTLFLVSIVAATGAALSYTATTESLIMEWVANDLDHQLALDSFLVCLPQLLAETKPSTQRPRGNEAVRYISMEYGRARISCRVSPESGKFHVAKHITSEQLRAELLHLARSNGLSAENIRPQPVIGGKEADRTAAYYWFDQIINPTAFEEIFRWSSPRPEGAKEPVKHTWSDLVSFWNTSQGDLLALEVETTIGSDSRRWYVIVRVAGAKTEVLCREAI